MTLPELLAQFDEIQSGMRSLIIAKNSDYTGNAEDRFANLTLIETVSRGAITAEMGVLVRMTDKLSRAMTLMSSTSDPRVQESIEDTIKDMSNYGILLIMLHRRHHACVQSPKESKAAVKPAPVITPAPCNDYTGGPGSAQVSVLQGDRAQSVDLQGSKGAGI